MEIYFIPYTGKYIIYCPLKRLAFLGNSAMIKYIKSRLDRSHIDSDNEEIEGFLNSINFWQKNYHRPDFIESKEKEYLPTMAVLLMTNTCNLKCKYCYAKGGEKSDQWMSAATSHTVIDRVYENAKLLKKDHYSLAFHGGGEPVLHWDVLEDAVLYTQSKDITCHISMSSNGIWTEKKYDFIIKHFNELSISFDGIKKVQDSQRPFSDGKGSFNAVFNTLQKLDRINFSYGIRLTVMSDTVKYLPESLLFICKNTRCKTIQVEPCYSSERGEYTDPTQEQAGDFTKAFLKAHKIALSNRRTFFYSGARPWLITNSFCRAYKDALVVTPQDDIVTCFEVHDRTHLFFDDFAIGRVINSKIELFKDKIISFENRLKKIKQSCRDCFCYWHCCGDCLSRFLSSNQNPLGRCLVNRNIIREILLENIALGNGVWYVK